MVHGVCLQSGSLVISHGGLPIEEVEQVHQVAYNFPSEGIYAIIQQVD
jgi:hypothetical protein